MIVEMPDGTKVSFPDDMPKEEIKRLIVGKFPETAQPQEKPHDVSSIASRMYELGPTESAMRIGGGLAEGAKNLATGVVQSAKDAFTAPGRALTGELRMTDESGRTSPEAIAEGFNMATWVNPASVAMGTGKQIARNAALEAAKRPPTEGAMVAQAARDIGVSLPRAVTSDSAAVQQMGKVVANVPIAGQPLRNASKTAIQQMDDVATGVQKTLGTGDKAIAGSKVVFGLDDFAKKIEPEKVTALYKRLEDGLNPDARIPLSNTKSVASTITARLEKADAGTSKAAEFVRKAIENPQGKNFDEIKTLRETFREIKSDRVALSNAGMSQKQAEDIYNALSRDLEAAAKAGGGDDALTMFKEANNRAFIFARDKEALGKIIGKNADEKITSNLIAMAQNTSRANIKDLMLAKSKVSAETWDELSSAALADMGRDTTGAFTPDRFVTAWNKLSPSGKKVLFGQNHPEHMKALDDLATVSTRFKKLNEYANPSGTAQSVLGGSYFTGLYVAPTTTISSLIGANMTARLLAKPATAKAVADYAKAYEVAVKMPGRTSQTALANKAKALALVAANGNEVGASNLAAKLATVQQTAADQENGEQLGGPEGNPEADQAGQQFNDAYLQGRAF